MFQHLRVARCTRIQHLTVIPFTLLTAKSASRRSRGSVLWGSPRNPCLGSTSHSQARSGLVTASSGHYHADMRSLRVATIPPGDTYRDICTFTLASNEVIKQTYEWHGKPCLTVESSDTTQPVTLRQFRLVEHTGSITPKEKYRGSIPLGNKVWHLVELPRVADPSIKAPATAEG